MAQIEPQESQENLRASLGTSVEIISLLHRHGSPRNWVVRDQARLRGGLFINRSEALRFAMLENGRRPQAVIMVSGILEFSIEGPTKAAANDSTGVTETNGRVRAS